MRRRFLAWFDTLRFMKANKAETIRITQPWMKLLDAIASETYDAETPSFFTDGHIDKKKLAVVQQALVDVGVIDASSPRPKSTLSTSVSCRKSAANNRGKVPRSC